jgi:hypothetical protein
MSPRYIERRVRLEPKDYKIVASYARRTGLGTRNFSAALRIIIREWAFTHPRPPYNPLSNILDTLNHQSHEENGP